MFCPKCGSILLPKTDKNRKRILACSCGYSDKQPENVTLKEDVTKDKDVEVIEEASQDDLLPVMETECPKCGNKEAYYYTAQTRASDEPETKFLKCKACKHKWRDYS